MSAPQIKIESALLTKFKEILASDSPALWAKLSPDEKQLLEQYKLQVGSRGSAPGTARG